MAIKINYQYNVYPNCEEATAISKEWEKNKARSLFAIKCFVWLGNIVGSIFIAELLQYPHKIEYSILRMCFLVFSVIMGVYFIAYKDIAVKYKCQELYLNSQKNTSNNEEIELMIYRMKDEKKEKVKKSLLKFLVKYFVVMCVIVIAFSL